MDPAERDLFIFSLLLEGLTPDEIAEVVGWYPVGVHVRLRHLMAMFGASTLIGLVQRVSSHLGAPLELVELPCPCCLGGVVRLPGPSRGDLCVACSWFLPAGVMTGGGLWTNELRCPNYPVEMARDFLA